MTKDPKKSSDGSLSEKMLQAQVKDLEKQLAELTREKDQLKEQTDARQSELSNLKELAARAQADLQNAKNRLEQDGRRSRMFALESFFKELLPAVDNLQRAFSHLPEDLRNHEWIKGIEAIEKHLLGVLSKEGLKKIEAKGQPVNPAFHEVLMSGPGQKDLVTEVLEEGYQLHGRVLRPAKVKVGDGSS